MGKFNTKGYDTAKTTNMEGGISYDRQNLKKEITSVILTSMLNGDLYYEKETDRVNRVLDLIKLASKNPSDVEFIIKAMVYTRTVANLRSITHLMAVGISENVRGNPLFRKGLKKSIVRPDDQLEILSLWNTRHSDNSGKATMLPNSIRRAFKDVLESKFDEYQLKKYSAPKSKVKMSDVIKLSHPKGRYETFKQVIEGTLQQAETMNTKLSSGVEAKVAFKELLVNRKMGYMQAIKHIRNAVVDGVDKDTLQLWANYVTNDKAIKNSRMLPFRYFDAWKEVKALNIDEFDKEFIKRTLETAFGKSATNLELNDSNERIVILLDESGSMEGKMFHYGKVLSASLMLSMGDSQIILYGFATNARRINIDVIKKSPFDWIEDFKACGGGTHFSAPLESLIKTRTKTDKLIIFTDMQLYAASNNYIDSFNKYYNKYRELCPNFKTLFWNLAGYTGGTPLKLTNSILEVSGYSDSLLPVINKLWKDPSAMIQEIEEIQL